VGRRLGSHDRATAVRRGRDPAQGVLSVQDKQGRSGPLTFVVVQHQILQRGQVIIDERQDIVYRAASSSPSAPQEAPMAEGAGTVPAADGEWRIDISPVPLFRFSALTYNAYRIHYDHAARAVSAMASAWRGPCVSKPG
jgi:3-methylfumaryl-CoA hydratase